MNYRTSIFFYKIIFNWEFSRSKLLASHANKSTVQSANGDGFPRAPQRQNWHNVGYLLVEVALTSF